MQEYTIGKDYVFSGIIWHLFARTGAMLTDTNASVLKRHGYLTMIRKDDSVHNVAANYLVFGRRPESDKDKAATQEHYDFLRSHNIANEKAKAMAQQMTQMDKKD